MVPPFLAYNGVATSDVGLLKEAANQCKLYHDVLEQQSGPWLHIKSETSGGTNDLALWSTGNGWAAAGMSRVFATMRKSPFNSQTTSEQSQLSSMIKDILDGSIAMDTDSSGLLRNYLNDTTWWGEISGTSILAATALRMAKLDPNNFGSKYVDWAAKKKQAVDSKINTGNGIVSPAINPLDWHDRNQYTSGSPEGQSFVVLMYAAWADLKGGFGRS
jgi:rhamnogalacturonyl hydrolase YesR